MSFTRICSLPRASFVTYNNVKDACKRDVTRSKTLSLSGTWKFSLAKSPFDAAPDFFRPRFNASSWGKIEVPGMWQLQGYGKGPQWVDRVPIEMSGWADF